MPGRSRRASSSKPKARRGRRASSKASPSRRRSGAKGPARDAKGRFVSQRYAGRADTDTLGNPIDASEVKCMMDMRQRSSQGRDTYLDMAAKNYKKNCKGKPVDRWNAVRSSAALTQQSPCILLVWYAVKERRQQAEFTFCMRVHLAFLTKP